MMIKGKVKRKVSKTRRHAIYCITNKKTGEAYIGLTFVRPVTSKKDTRTKMPMKSVMHRFQAHRRNALNGSSVKFHEALRNYGEFFFRITILEIVRGKEKAHIRETQLIHEKQPTYNMTGIKQ